MPKYVIREGKYSSGLHPESTLKVAIEYEDPEDSIKTVKTFDAVCWCAAQQVFRQYQEWEPYDMKFCKEDKEKDWDLCPHFDSQLESLEVLERGLDSPK